MSIRLKPGDMCVVTNGHALMATKYRDLIGSHVIVLRLRPVINAENPCEPYYDVSGCRTTNHLSHLVLKKIPPPPMDAAEIVAELISKQPECV